MSIWTAASDQDYDLETGNSDRWENVADQEYDAMVAAARIEACNADLDADPEYDAWLASTGALDPIDECAFDSAPAYDDTLGRNEHVGGFAVISRS